MMKSSVSRKIMVPQMVEHVRENEITLLTGYNCGHNLVRQFMENDYRVIVTNKARECVSYNSTLYSDACIMPDGISFIKELNPTQKTVLIVEDCDKKSAYIEAILYYIQNLVKNNSNLHVLLLATEPLTNTALKTLKVPCVESSIPTPLLMPFKQEVFFQNPKTIIEHIASLLLMITFLGLDYEKINFIHKYTKANIEEALDMLLVFGAFDKENHITEDGLIMARIPLAVRFARMLTKGIELNTLEDIISICALYEANGIRYQGVKYASFTSEQQCDFLAELLTFKAISKKLENGEAEPFKGIVEVNYYRALEYIDRLKAILSSMRFDISSTGNHEHIRKACAAGLIDRLYVRTPHNWYVSSDPYDTKRKLDNESCVLPTQYVLGLPKDITFKTPYENTLFIITFAFYVKDVSFLEEIAPHLVTKTCEKVYDFEQNRFYQMKTVCFNGMEIRSSESPILDVNEKFDMLAKWLTDATLNSDVQVQNSGVAKMLELNREFFKGKSLENIKEYYLSKLNTYGKMVPNLQKKKNYQFFTVDF